MNQPLSLAGTPAASPLGYYSWAFGQAARDPFYIMVVIYIFFPYFSSVVVGDPVRGQALIGYINASVGFVLAATILFLGAIADTVGRRKPWILATYGTIALGGFLLWLVKPGGAGLSLYSSVGLIFIIMVAFAYAEVFHNAMSPSASHSGRESRRSLGFGVRPWKFRCCINDGLGTFRLRSARCAGLAIPTRATAIWH